MTRRETRCRPQRRQVQAADPREVRVLSRGVSVTLGITLIGLAVLMLALKEVSK